MPLNFSRDHDYTCPNCEADVTVGETDAKVRCTECDTMLKVSRDAEFSGEMWRDLTVLVPVAEQADKRQRNI